MKLTTILAKMGLVVTVPAAPATPAAPGAKLVTRVVTLEELRRKAREVKDADFQELVRSGLGLEASFEQVYAAAKVARPGHGWDVDRVLARLADPRVQALAPAKVREQLAIDLADALAPPEDVLADAQRRDEALDRYEAQLVAKVDEWRTDVMRRQAALRVDAERLLAEAQDLERSVPAVEKKLEAWRERKRGKEDELERVAAAVAEKAPKYRS